MHQAGGPHLSRPKAQINLRSSFDRKNYFYPDLPQGYQISQYKAPVVGEGEVVLDMPDGDAVTVGIERLHLEQDAGKSLHDRHPAMSLVDLNRAGVALMEIVSKPDLRSSRRPRPTSPSSEPSCAISAPAKATWRRATARRRERLGAQARRAARHPLRDQERELDPLHRPGDRARGPPPDRNPRGWRQVEQETRLFDPAEATPAPCAPRRRRTTIGIFPIPIYCRSSSTAAYVDELKSHLPELPDEKKVRFTRDYGLSTYDAGVLVGERETADFFEAVAKGRDAKAAANWVINELAGRLNKEGRDIAGSPVSAWQLGAILDLIAAGTISGKIAKDVFEIGWSEGGDRMRSWKRAA